MLESEETASAVTVGDEAGSEEARSEEARSEEARSDGVMRAQVLETIDAIRPALQADGGDMSLVSVDEGTGVVEVQLVGACGSCPASTMTLKAGVERILMDRVPGVTEVVALGVDGFDASGDLSGLTIGR